MDSSVLVNEDGSIDRHFSRSQSLEMAFQEALRNTDSIVRDEDSRRLRLRIVMLENENVDLYEQVAARDDRIDLLEQECEVMRSQLNQAQEVISRRENEERAQAREFSNLKAELESMDGIATNSTKLLKEKLAISRELTSLKPELDHLRTQASYQQSVLAEKLALERKVSTLEVELEAEKRALQHATRKTNNAERETELQRQVDEAQSDFNRLKREGEKTIRNLQKELDVEQKALKNATQKSRRSLEKEVELEQQLNEVQSELLKEKHDADRNRRDAEKELRASEARQAAIESRLDQTRAKLRAMKEQLKDCQIELARAKASTMITEPSKASQNKRKRTALEMSTDEAIGTPDGVAARGKRPSARRGALDQAAVGEKSMFSITPYLNRTVNMTVATPDGESENGEDEADEEGDDKLPTTEGLRYPSSAVDLNMLSPTVVQQVKKKKSTDSAPLVGQILGESKASAKNRNPPQKKPRVVSTLEIVTEEIDENNEQEEAATEVPKITIGTQVRKKQPKSTAQNLEGDDGEQKKKKRTLLGSGKTLFDEEDVDTVKRPAKVNLGPSRSLVKGALKSGLKPGLATKSSFSTFSPLKKDRRGLGASFLG